MEINIDVKHTIWLRAKVEVNTVEEAQEMFEKGLIDDWDYLYDTLEEINPEDNLNQPTIEYLDEDGNTLLTNVDV